MAIARVGWEIGSGGRRLAACLLAALGALAGLWAAPSAGAGQGCPTWPAYAPGITSPSEAIPGFPQRRATVAELNDYVRLLDSESARVVTRRFATSVEGTPLYYSLVGRAGRVGHADQVAAQQERLRRPGQTSRREAAAIAEQSPAIAWYAGNVHGNETSGADAAVTLLYELAARTDCAAERIRRDLLTGVITTQNPDGRNALSRTNAYGFDMNRDWFARTQPETDGKLDVLSRFPPVVFVDAHEMGGSDYFFPPNADPIHHEVSPQSVSWINDVYGRALRRTFERRQQSDPANWDYFNYDIYDLFYMGYGDTVPTTAFTAAGMTFEKGVADSDEQRWEEQRAAGWTTLRQAAANKQAILRGYAKAHRVALAEGRAGRLEPNQVLQPGNEVQSQVPDMRVRNYFFDRRSLPDAAELVDRLVEMDVRVYRLTEPLAVPGLQRYGRSAQTRTLPRGTFWVPMAQPQKRWVQALLGEDSYVPFPYFYDVTAWSNPLLMNLDASFTGAPVDPAAARVRSAPTGAAPAGPPDRGFLTMPGETGREVAAALFLERRGARISRLPQARQGLDEGTFVFGQRVTAADLDLAVQRFGVRIEAERGAPPAGTTAVAAPKLAVYSSTGESLEHLRFLLGRVWHLPYDELTGAQVAAGQLTSGDYDAFVVPGVPTADLNAGTVQLRNWIENGGVFVGTARPGGTGGTPYAVANGFTTSETSRPGDLQVPGTMFRVRLGGSTPATVGAPRFSYWYHLGEDVLSPSDTGVNAARYPGARPDFFVSGYAEGEEALKGSAGLVDEDLGSGRVVLFSGEPNFRAYTDGMSFLLANAIAYPDSVGPAQDVGSAGAREAVAAARASELPEIGPGRPMRIEVPSAQAATAEATVRGLGATGVSISEAGGSTFLTIPNPRGLDAEEHPFAAKLLPALEEAGVDVRSAVL